MELSVSNGTVLATRLIYMFLLRDRYKKSCYFSVTRKKLHFQTSGKLRATQIFD